MVFSKVISSEPLACTCQKEQSVFHLSEPSADLVWLTFPTAYSFLMISPNLHDIWVVFFLNLSQELKLVLLLYFRILGDGCSLKGSKK
jgi:hypothetical protein